MDKLIKKITLAGLLVLSLTLVALTLAATSGGTVNIRLNPDLATINTGGRILAQINFNTQGKFISAATVLLTYTYDGANPGLELSETDIVPNQDLINQGWRFPFKKVEVANGEVKIKIAGYTMAFGGYSSGGSAPNFQEVNLAALNFKGSREGVFNLKFSNLETKITEKSSAGDFLLNPASPAAGYTVSAGGTIQSLAAFQQGINGYLGVLDTYIDRDYADKSYCSASIKVGNKQKYLGLLKFDLSSIPADAHVNSVVLEIYALGWGGKGLTIEPFGLTSEWVLPCPSWSKKPTQSDSRGGAVVTVDGINKWYQFSMYVSAYTRVMQSGIALQGESSYDSNKIIIFAGSEYADPRFRPRLIINYTR